MKNVKQVVLSLMLAVATQALATDGGTPAPSGTRWLPEIHLDITVNAKVDIIPPENPPPPARGAVRREPKKQLQKEAP